MIKRSSLLTIFFDKECAKVGIHRSLRADVCTRWNSTLQMIESFLALRMVIVKLFDEKQSLHLSSAQTTKLSCLELTSSEWCLLKVLSQILKPFQLATTLLSARRYPTIGLCLFCIYHIKTFLEDSEADTDLEKRLKNCLLEKMTKYIDNEKEQMRIIRVSSPLTKRKRILNY
jgi:hypothetical protein